MATPTKKPATEEKPVEAPVKKVSKPVDTRAKLKANVPLFEPFLNIRFNPNAVVEVAEITNWMQCQIDAGLLNVVKDEPETK